MSEAIRVRFAINGEDHELDVEPRRLLVDVIRHDVGLTGTHVGCEQGVCGMCTVLLNDDPVKSCLMLAPQAAGRRLTTVESLAPSGELDPLQRSFKRHHALQCGFCTPGFLMTALGLKRAGRALTREELRHELAGVLCRCTGYEGIVTAVDEYLREAGAGATGRAGAAGAGQPA
jgi:aerobic-type carbon monoxide dehydrogenase small subunit (CoxS/CutS family)